MREINEQEAERLVNAYSDLILRLAYTYLRSTQDAEDICQNVFLKLLAENRQFGSPSHEKAWVIRATVNACKDELKAFRRKAASLEEAAEAAAPEIPGSDILEAVASLPKKYRETVYLFYYEGYSIREIGKLLRRSESAVAAQLSRGRKMLKNLLGGEINEQKC